MTIECVTCERFSLRGGGKELTTLAQHGFGLCAIRPRYELHPATRQHDCAQHTPAAPEKVQARREWLAKIDARAAQKGSR